MSWQTAERPVIRTDEFGRDLVQVPEARPDVWQIDGEWYGTEECDGTPEQMAEEIRVAWLALNEVRDGFEVRIVIWTGDTASNVASAALIASIP